MTQGLFSSIAIGLWGANGHQIHHELRKYPRLRLIGLGGFDDDTTADLCRRYSGCAACDTYEELLALPGLQMVSLCSPKRADQAGDAIAALNKGIHVYAEKPCATSEPELDRLFAAAERSTAVFHEMADTVCQQPYWAMRRIVQQGMIGTVVQVLAQKSYPFHEGRPRDESIDGGLIAQCGVHALRFVEHVAGLCVSSIEAAQTRLGDYRDQSDLKMAAVMMGKLENDGLFSVVANYLNPKGFGLWGNEMLRIFGDKGLIESVDGGIRTRLIIGNEDRGEINVTEDPPDWLSCVIANAFGGHPMPFDLESELHPTRMVLKAKAYVEGRSRRSDPSRLRGGGLGRFMLESP